MNSREPASAAPTGAPRPLVKSIHTESKALAYSPAAMPLATTAFMRRAPSRCVRRPPRRATSVTEAIRASGQIEPPPRLLVCSTQRRRLFVVLAACAVKRVNVYARECCGTTGLEVDRMRGAMSDHLIARPAVHAQRNLVTHRTGRKEQCSFLAEQLGDHLLQRVDGRILKRLLVADLRLAHELAHRPCGARDGIA